MPEEVQNLGASVRARLQNLSRQRNQPFDLLLTRYVLERLLYRLGSSEHRDRFILKGALRDAMIDVQEFLRNVH